MLLSTSDKDSQTALKRFLQVPEPNKNLWYGFVPLPRFYKAMPNFSKYASILNFDIECGRIIYKTGTGHYVDRVEWFDYLGNIDRIDYYGDYGYVYRTDYVAEENKTLLSCYKNSEGIEQLMYNHSNGTITLYDNGFIKKIFSNNEEFTNWLIRTADII